MRFLLVVKQAKNVDAFLETLRVLAARGHSVTLAIQDRDEQRDQRLANAINQAQFAIVKCPAVRSDDWADVASLLRRMRDTLHYLRPPMRAAAKLRARAIDRLRQDLSFEPDTSTFAHALQSIPADQTKRLDSVLALAEQALPPDPLFDEFLTREKPDLLLLSPLVHFGPAQADLVASARRLEIPVSMLLYSWDNLSTKGALHRWPDRMFVWNERQRSEAHTLHRFPPERVVVVGAPRFDAFFALEPAMTREQFHEPLRLDPARPTVLYTCSSRFVAESELGFITKWVRALRQSSSETLRECNLLVRPHPDIALLPAGTPMPQHRWPAAPGLSARVGRPFDDPRVVVLQTRLDTPQGLFESIVHSAAVVGLNTTAELEAGIAGRPVFTILADERDADGQSGTVHFHYLTKEAGGFVASARSLDEHVTQIDATLREPVDPAPIRTFIESFLRPLGIDRPVSPLLADAVEEAAAARHAPPDAERALPEATALDSAPTPRTDVNRAVLPLSYLVTPALHVYASPAARRIAQRGTVPVDPVTADWIEQDVALGEVLYDVGAGIGEYTVIAAKRRGAVVIAFEPGYAAYGALCDNVLLNACEALVVPIPLALASRDGLTEIKYLEGQPGEQGYMVREDIDHWRVKHRGPNKPYLQPACLVRLDTLVERQRLPSPNHLRLSPGTAVASVLAGAPLTLQAPSLKTICLHLPRGGDAIEETLAGLGWSSSSRHDGPESSQRVFRRR